MNSLIPFKENPLKISVLAAAVFSQETRTLFAKFELQDRHEAVEYSHSTQKVMGRKHDLWKKTCFEIFLRPFNQESYYEINLATDGYWNGYEFSSYREPQPPQESQKIELLQYHWNSEKRMMTTEIRIDDSADTFQMGLSAVIKYKALVDVTYFSLKHRPDKADFHWVESFTLTKDRKWHSN